MNHFSRQRPLSCGLALLLGCGCVFTAGRADAWGGHDVVMRAIVERLPGELCVGRASTGERRLGTAAVLPTVALHPYLFDNPSADAPLADVRFDAAGRGVLMETLERLE